MYSKWSSEVSGSAVYCNVVSVFVLRGYRMLKVRVGVGVGGGGGGGGLLTKHRPPTPRPPSKTLNPRMYRLRTPTSRSAHSKYSIPFIESHSTLNKTKTRQNFQYFLSLFSGPILFPGWINCLQNSNMSRKRFLKLNRPTNCTNYLKLVQFRPTN